MIQLAAPLPELFTRSRRLVLNFKDIPADTPANESIAAYFKQMEGQGKNPRLPQHRQAFNNSVLASTGCRYLVSAYGEDRIAMLQGSSIAQEGRTIHLGVDIFCKDTEPVMAPCSGTIVRTGRENEAHSFGNYVILQPDDNELPFLFFGHLSFDLPKQGHVEKGQTIGALGDYANNENGGWSRHLHLQCLRDLPPAGQASPGYGSAGDTAILAAYPDPMAYFPSWKLIV